MLFGLFNGILQNLDAALLGAALEGLTANTLQSLPLFQSSSSENIKIKGGIPTLLLYPPSKGEYRRVMVVADDADIRVGIFPRSRLSEEEIARLKISKKLPSGWAYEDSQIGGYLWAYSISDTLANLTIESSLIISENSENMPLSIQLALPTENLDLKWTQGVNFLDDSLSQPLKSTHYQSGFKLFYFADYSSQKTYDFSLSLNPNYGLNLSKNFPINVYLFDFRQIAKAIAWLRAAQNPFSAFGQPASGAVTCQSLLKNKDSWVAGFKSSGGSFTMSPSSTRRIGCIDIDIGWGYSDGAVFDYQPFETGEGGTFTILGI